MAHTQMANTKGNKSISKEKIKQSIAKNLRTARMAFEPKLTQESVAQFFNPPLTRAAIAQWEVGDTLPDVDRLAILSKAYGVTIDALIFGNDKPVDIDELSPEAVRIAREFMKLDVKQRQVFKLLIRSMA